MKLEKLILVKELCRHYEVEISFFEQAESFGLLPVENISDEKYIHRKQLKNVEKIFRLHHDLEINMEGIDVILNLMKKIKQLEKELQQTRSHLSLYEN